MNAGRNPVTRVCYQFGSFLLDPASRLLLRDGDAVPLPAKAYELLIILLTNRDRVVDKSEMLASVWQGVIVEENTLTRHISTLRKALGDDQKQQAIIRTVSGYGYQFVAEVTELSERPSPVEAPAATEELAEEMTAPVPVIAPVEPEPVTPVAAPAPLMVELAKRPHAGRFVAALIAMLVLAVAALIIVPAVNARFDREKEWRVRQFTFLSGLQRSPSWSPDGQAVVFVSDANGHPDLWVQKVDEPRAMPLTNTPEIESTPDWSPDGRWIAFRSETQGGGLFVVPSTGGTPRKIADFGYRPRWAPRGSRILFSTSEYTGGLPKFYVVDAEGGAPQALRPDLAQNHRMAYVNWRPNGDVSFSGRQVDGVWRFCTTAIEAGPVKCPDTPAAITTQMESAGLTLGRFAWSPSGTFIYFEGTARESKSLWRVAVDASTLVWQRAPERLTTGTTEDVEFALAPDGRQVIFSARSTQHLVWAYEFDPLAGKILGSGHALTSGAGDEQDVAVSRDAKRLAYRAIRGGRDELWEQDGARGGSTRLLLAGDEWDRTFPLWSPDGTRIIYTRRLVDARGNRTHTAVVMLTVGSRNEQVVFDNHDDTTLVPQDWSADGTTLLGHCSGTHGGLRSVCKARLPTAGAESPVVEVIASDPTRNLWQEQFSPNQKWISFIAVDALDAGVATIYTVPAGGGTWNAITDGTRYDDKPRWSRDGRTLYFVSDRNGVENLWARHIDPSTGTPQGEPFRVTSFTSPASMVSTNRVRRQFALTDKKLFVPIEKGTGELWLVEGLDP